MFGLFNRPPKGFLLTLFKLTRHFGTKRPPDPDRVKKLAFNPDAPWSEIVDAGTALLDAGRFEEADVVFENGLFAFPNDKVLRIRHALSANNSGRYKIAIVRWEAALRVAPDRSICRVGLAANFRESGDISTARRWITGALQLWPQDESVLSEAARIAETDGLFAESLALWERLTAKRDPHPDCLRGHAHCLILLGRFDEAKDTVEAALALYPEDHRILAIEAMLAAAREDWPKALALWSAYRRRFPDDQTGWEHYGRTVQASQEADHQDESDAPVSGPRAPLIVDRQEDDEVRGLLLGFESIGDNCEFGSVQRRFGAEPLGLLRWNDVELDDLLAALDNRFAGMGEADHTELPLLENGEFVVRDKRWGLWMHTFQFQGQTDRETLYPKMCQRVAYLRDKLLADLEEAEKIFVFRSNGLNGEQIETLHRALWAHGPVRLLNVQPTSALTGFLGEPGQVVKIDERRYVGFLGRLGVAEGNYWDIAFDDWVSICRAAAA